jgi:hypothetical protein
LDNVNNLRKVACVREIWLCKSIFKVKVALIRAFSAFIRDFEFDLEGN